MKDLILINKIRQQIRAGKVAEVRDQIQQLDAAEALTLIAELPQSDRLVAFRLLPKDIAILVFEELSANVQQDLIQAMQDPEASRLILNLEADERTRLFEELPAKVVKRLLAVMPEDSRAVANELLAYPPNSAGRQMNPRYFAARGSETVDQVLDRIRNLPDERTPLETVFVIDNERHYLGYIPLANLIRAAGEAQVSAMVQGEKVSVQTTDSQVEAAKAIRAHNVSTLAIVDQENRLVGVLTDEDVIEILEEESSELMYEKAGLKDLSSDRDVVFSEKLTSGSIAYPVRVRILFLMVTLAGGLAVGGLIDRFEDTLAAILAAAVFIPLIMDMGGNVGTQSTTIFARGFALGHIDIKRFWPYFLREGSIGLTMGLGLGVIGGTVAYFWQGAPNNIPQLGIAVGVSLATVVTLAAMLGFLLPYIMIKIGVDHAPGADPFITTIKDFTGLALYFTLVATLIGTPDENGEDDLVSAFGAPPVYAPLPEWSSQMPVEKAVT